MKKGLIRRDFEFKKIKYSKETTFSADNDCEFTCTEPIRNSVEDILSACKCLVPIQSCGIEHILNRN